MTTKRRLLSAAEILAAPDAVREEVPTDEWGEGTAVLVQAMNVAQRAAWRLWEFARNGDGNLVPRDEVDFRASLVICSAVDESGKPLFERSQLDALMEKSIAPMDRIADVAMRLSRLRAEDQEAARAALDPTTTASASSSQATSG